MKCDVAEKKVMGQMGTTCLRQLPHILPLVPRPRIYIPHASQTILVCNSAHVGGGQGEVEVGRGEVRAKNSVIITGLTLTQISLKAIGSSSAKQSAARYCVIKTSTSFDRHFSSSSHSFKMNSLRGGMQVHAVPESERAVDASGRRLPWGYEYAE